MPTYVYECRGCGRRWEAFHIMQNRHAEACMKCPSETDCFIVPSTSAVHIFESMVVDDLDVHPVKIESKGQYREELKKRGLECRGLM